MINLEHFVSSIHLAADAAAQTVMEKNLALLDTFFDEAEPTDENALVADTTVVSTSVIKPTIKSHLSAETQVAAEVIQKAAEAVTKAAEALKERQEEIKEDQGEQKEKEEQTESEHQGGDIDKGEKKTEKPPRHLKPKMVGMQYPKMTADGPRIHTVYVPLISLVPISQLQLTELKFNVDLEIGQVDNQLHISFPAKTGGGAAETNQHDEPKCNTSAAKLEIQINTTTRPDGMTHLIQGFDRALRGQIPG